ncbi:MAG: sugar transferase [Termitinemataceae bacterium]|nr:MAG: sugar transferase [Termitinemataceae bacterium]
MRDRKRYSVNFAEEKQLIENIKKLYKHNSSFISGISVMFVDCVSIMLTLGIGFFLVNLLQDGSLINFRSFVYYWIFLPLFLAVFYAEKLYPGIMLSPADEVRRCSVSLAFCFGGVAIAIAIIGSKLQNIPINDKERLGICAAFIISVPIGTILVPFFREIFRKIVSRFLWWGVSTVIYCQNKDISFFTDRLIDHPENGYRPVLIINSDECKLQSYRSIPVRSPSDEVHNLIQALHIKSAIIIEGDNDMISNKPLGDKIISMYRYTLLIPHTKNILSVSVNVRDIGGILGFSTTNNLTKTMNLFLKRFIDLAFILITSPLLFLIFLLISIVIKLSSPGPVFYGHPRIGKNGKKFKAWKFRTMIVDADKKLQELLNGDPSLKEEWERETKLRNDPRITPIGKLLRKTSMDELPQIANIFLGQMSFVGPRPIPITDFSKYEKTAKYRTEYTLSVTPGLSGMWQISGRSDTGYEERIMLDSYYIQNWSIWLDIWIILKTVGVVLNAKGAY